jgi:hypothetical protein
MAPNPLCLGDPRPITLVVGDRRQLGVDDCGGLQGDTCGPLTQSLPADRIVRVPKGQLLRFELPEDQSHFVIWSLSWVAESDAERAQAAYESGTDVVDPAWRQITEGVLTEGSVLELPGPPPGEWSVVLRWTDDRDDAGGDMRTLFRLAVAG